MNAGDQVEVACGDGWIYLVELSAATGGCLEGNLIQKERTNSEPTTQINLYFALSQREKVEWILQKGTETGVFSFHPFTSRRTLLRKSDITANRQKRWEAIIREAAEQSKRGLLPELKQPGDLSEIITADKENARLAAVIGSQTQDLGSILKKISTNRELDVFIGPEGGFDPEEIDQMKINGFLFFSMGRRILRMETAAIIAPALILYELGDMDNLK